MSERRKMKTKQTQGFTLIEVIIVVGIVGVLSAISIGFYGNHVVSANRTEARAALTSTAASLEKCRALYGAYDNASCNVTLPFDTEEDLYTISSVPAASAFTLTATPVAGKRQLRHFFQGVFPDRLNNVFHQSRPG